MFERLKDQSFLNPGHPEHKKILIVEDRDGRVTGTAGTVYPEKEAGLPALAVDPADGESAMYCSSACVRRLRTWEQEYMTIFCDGNQFQK